jgi:serine O-acetyltransferase
MESVMSTNLKTANVTAMDPVWDAVVSGARQVVASEPSLTNLLYSNVLNHDGFEDALAHRLAERLDHPDVSADLIRQAFREALEARPEIGLEARADLAATLSGTRRCTRRSIASSTSRVFTPSRRIASRMRCG